MIGREHFDEDVKTEQEVANWHPKASQPYPLKWEDLQEMESANSSFLCDVSHWGVPELPDLDRERQSVCKLVFWGDGEIARHHRE
jgi:hypothetical protein